MAIQVKHSKVSTIPDADDTSLVRPSDWNADHTLTGTIDIINGGTGASTATSAINNLLPTQTGQSGKYLSTDGTDPQWLTVPTGGGGSSVSYYLNGGTNQGTFGGNTYYQMSKTAVIGTAANFTIAANGYIAQFLTDANDPALLNIPAGNWNFEMFFAASSSGGTPSFYVELYKYDGITFTLIASGSSSPELITGGTIKDLYTTALAVPATSLTLTDRLAVRVYVNNSGRTITLYTQDANLCQVITTFSTGITALNGLTAQVQTFATGTTGTDFNISSVTDTHTFNIPSASATNRGLLTSADWTTFNNKGNGTVTQIIAGTGLTGGTITSSGTIAIDSTVATLTGTQTLTNKRVTPRVSTTTSSATPTINTDNVDVFGLTAQTADITSFTTNLSGTPTDGQRLLIYIVGTAARAITWGASFEASTVSLPTTTVSTNRLDVGFIWNAATSKWRCVAVA